MFQVALRSGQLEGQDQESLEWTYDHDLLVGFLDGAEVPYSAIKDSILDAEALLAEVIANDGNHPGRRFLTAQSSTVASQDPIPTAESGGDEFIGVFSGIYDATDGEQLTEGSIGEIRRALRGSATWMSLTTIYKYHMTAEKIFHTRTNVVFEGCAWDRDTQETAFETAAGTSPLPAGWVNLLIVTALSTLSQEAWFQGDAAMYGQMASTMLAIAKARELTMPSLPDTTMVAEPVRN